MDNLLRTYAHVRKKVHQYKKERVDIEKLFQSITPPPPYLKTLKPPALTIDLSGPADVLIKNARIFPRDNSRDNLSVIALKHGRIGYIGNDTAGLTDQHTTIIDAEGNSVIPGLCDSHLHLMVGAEHQQGCNVESIRDPETLKQTLRTFVREHPDYRVYFVYGLHYMDTPLIPPDTARHMLDEIVSDKPMFVYAHDLHTGWANTQALDVADLMHHMPPYPQLLRDLDVTGNMELDKENFPSGELREPPVYFIVEEALRTQFPLTVEEKKSFLQQACQSLSSLGLTSVHNMGLDLPEEDIECLMLLLELEQEDRLPIRVHSSYSVVPDGMMLEDVLHAANVRNIVEQARMQQITWPDLYQRLFKLMNQVLHMRQAEKQAHPSDMHSLWHHFLDNFQHIITASHLAEFKEKGMHFSNRAANQKLDKIGKVHCKAVKLFMDGVVEKDTAFRLDHHPLPGIPAFSPEALDLVILLADRLGLQVAAHSIGNGSVNTMLNAIELARTRHEDIDKKRGEKVRHRIEHIEMCNHYDIPRFHQLDVIASMQALHERAPVTLWHEKVPENQWSTAFAWKSLLESGSTLIFGSDWPIVSCNCFEGIQRAVSRKPWKPGMPDQHLSLEQALMAFSTEAAKAEYNEDIKGQISKGMLADLVILSENIAEHKGDYSQIKVNYTISDGKVVYRKT